MIVGRALQGLAAGVIPLGISIMRDELPAERLGSATALMSASLGVGGALGLPAAAFIADNFDWHVLFWASAALGAVAIVLVLALVPESQVRTGGRFDLVGALGLSAGLVCLLLAISKGADWGWTSGTTLGLFAAAVVVLLLWGWCELRSHAAAGRPAHHRPPSGAVHQPRLDRGRLLDVRDVPGRCPQLLQLPDADRLRPGQVAC